MQHKEQNAPVTIVTQYLYRVLNKDFNPFTPTSFVVYDNFIEIRRRNWYLISEDVATLHWEDVNFLKADKHMFGASVWIDNFYYGGFSKDQADELLKLMRPLVHASSQRGSTEHLASVLKDQLVNKQSASAQISVADELEKLHALQQKGVLSKEEFEEQKNKLLA